MIDLDQKARTTGDLKHFLKPYFTFRLYTVFRKDRKKAHFYGNEQQVTYSQLVHGHVSSIVLSREKGYRDLIDLVEKKWKGKCESAQIYMREEDGGPFNIICRRYYKDEIEECQDPLLPADKEKRILQYRFEKGNLVLSSEEAVLPDFKKEIDMHFKNTTAHA